MARQLIAFAALTLALGVLAAGLLSSAAYAQQPLQSLRPTQSACTAGSQSVRVCNNGLQSCNDVCAAQDLDAGTEIAGCRTACCNRFNVCLRSRNCGVLAIDCN